MESGVSQSGVDLYPSDFRDFSVETLLTADEKLGEFSGRFPDSCPEVWYSEEILAPYGKGRPFLSVVPLLILPLSVKFTS